MPRTCACCGWRDSTGAIEFDGRIVAACSSCLAEVPAPPLETHTIDGIHRDDVDDVSVSWRAIDHARHSDGVTVRQVAEALGLPDAWAWRNRVSVALSRAVKSGHLRRDDSKHNAPVYHSTDKAWAPRSFQWRSRKTEAA